MRRSALAIVIAAVVAAASATPSFAKDKLTIAMSTVGFAYLPALVANAINAYDDEDIAANIVITGGATKALAALIGNGAEVYFGDSPAVIRSRENGVDALIIGSCVSQYATNLVMSGKWAKAHNITAASTIEEKLKALKGATLGVTTPGSGTDLIARFFAKKAGLDPDRDMTLSSLGGTSILPAFAQGRIDGFAISAPPAELAVANYGAVMVFNLAKGEIKDLDGFLYTAIAVRQNWVEKNHAVAIRLLRAVEKALDAIHDPAKSNAARDAVWKKYWSAVDKKLFDEMWENWKGAFPKTVEIPTSGLKQVMDFTNALTHERLTPEAVDAAYTNKYAIEAVASFKK